MIDRNKIRALLARRGKSMRAVSLEAGLGETGVKDILRGKNLDPGFSKVVALAQALDVDLDELLREGAAAVRVVEAAGRAGVDYTLPVRGDLRAGSWQERDGDQDFASGERLPAPIDPRYQRDAQWVSRVRGDSMNDLRRDQTPAGILDGDLVHTVCSQAISYIPATGDVVEAERVRFEGKEREVSLKQVEITHTGAVLLWARSTNPKWKEPLRFGASPAKSGDAEVRIIGKVLQVIRPL